LIKDGEVMKLNKYSNPTTSTIAVQSVLLDNYPVIFKHTGYYKQ